MTASARIGEANDLTYEGHFGLGDPRGGDIALAAYVVWYEDP
jgi:hypothetical protein